jgi:hypothetical protein
LLGQVKTSRISVGTWTIVTCERVDKFVLFHVSTVFDSLKLLGRAYALASRSTVCGKR